MNDLHLILFLALLFAAAAVFLLLTGRQRCPRCDASIGSRLRQCPHCGQIMGLPKTEETAPGPPLYCPECRGEFRPGVLVCPDCGVVLQEQLPPPKETEAPAGVIQPKKLTSVLTPVEAEFILAALAEQNIRAVLLDAKHGGGYADGASLVTVGVGDIVVPEPDLARAKEILASIEVDPDSQAGECECEECQGEEEYVCDECGTAVGPSAKACPKCGAEFEEE